LRRKCSTRVSVPLAVAADTCAEVRSGSVAAGDPLGTGPVIVSGITPGAAERDGELRVLESNVRTSSGRCEGIFGVLS
jgi:hypothetical protein